MKREEVEVDMNAVAAATTALLAAIGYGVSTNPGLEQTPARVARFYAEMMGQAEPTYTTFVAESDQMIVQAGIPFYSLCEHHVLPFFGHAVVGYIPGETMLGLSKLARTVQWVARGLQNQERITGAVAEIVEEATGAKGVGVMLRAEHLCMSMRGARAVGSHTVTQALRGAFMEDPRTRDEFLALARAGATR